MQNKFYANLIVIMIWTLLAACAPAPAPAAEALPTPFIHTQPQGQSTQALTPPTKPVVASPLWTAQLSGAVNTAPFVIGDLVVVATADGIIQAVRADTGKPAWVFSPASKVWDVSVVGDEMRVCAGLQGGQVTCLDVLTGQPLWTVELGLEAQSNLAITSDRIYVPTTLAGPGLTNDYSGHASLFALDAATGDVIWEAVTDNYILRSPVALDGVTITGGAYQVDPQTPDKIASRIYAFNTGDGSVLWEYEADDGLVRWVHAAGGVVTFSAATETVYALNVQDGSPLWQFGPGYWMQYPVMQDGKIYFGSGDELFQALDASGGDLLWQHAINMSSLNQMGLPHLQDGRIWFNSVTGEIYALDAETGEQVEYLFTGRTARVGGALYQKLYILGDPDGKLSAYPIQ